MSNEIEEKVELLEDQEEEEEKKNVIEQQQNEEEEEDYQYDDSGNQILHYGTTSYNESILDMSTKYKKIDDRIKEKAKSMKSTSIILKHFKRTKENEECFVLNLRNKYGFHIRFLVIRRIKILVTTKDENLVQVPRWWIIHTGKDNGIQPSIGMKLHQAMAAFLVQFEIKSVCNECGHINDHNQCIPCMLRHDLSVKKACDICMMDRTDHYKLLCGHNSFCRPCLKRLQPHRCPLCRTGRYRVNRGFEEEMSRQEAARKEHAMHNADDSDDPVFNDSDSEAGF